MSAPELFRSDTLWPYFERLRKEEPVHYCTTCPVGDYWSVTKYNDIMHVDTNRRHFLVGREIWRHQPARREREL
jgi:cytochrome P450